MEQVDVLLPSSFNDTYEKYNQIQKDVYKRQPDYSMLLPEKREGQT